MEKCTKRNITLLGSAIAISNIGDVLFDLFITWSVVSKTGNIMDSVYMIGGSFLFKSILNFISGSIADYFNRKKLLIVSLLLSTAVISAFLIGYTYIIQYVPLCILFILLNDINNVIFSKAYITISGDLFQDNTFIKFQTYMGVVNKVIYIVGAGLSAWIIASIPSYFLIIMIDIVSYIMAALLIVFVSYQRPDSEKVDLKHKMVHKHSLRILLDKNAIKLFIAEFQSRKFIRYFVIVIAILNLCYGFIPNILPVIVADKSNDVTILGMSKTMIAVGEVIGLTIAGKKSHLVSKLFKASLVGDMLSMFLLIALGDSIGGMFLSFFLYGFFDALGQPIYSYNVSRIASNVRGRILGCMDTVLLLTPVIGMWIGAKISSVNHEFSLLFVIMVFAAALVYVIKTPLNTIVVKE